MFDGADFRSEEGTMSSPLRRARAASHPAAAASTLPANDAETDYVRHASGRYGERRRPNFVAIAIAAVLHVLVIAGVLLIRAEAPRERLEKRLITVNLTPPPPPPSQKAPPPSQPDVVAPKPPIQLVQKQPQVATTPDPAPTSLPSAPVSAPAAAPSPTPSVAPPAPPSTVHVSDLTARMIAGTPPRYPIDSRRKREQGTVLLALTLGVDGRVANISVSRSSGFDRLDQAALSAVRKWRWAPIVQDGKPVQVKGVVEIPFVIKD